MLANKPLVVRVGHVSVKVYRVSTGPGGQYEAFAVADTSSGKRRLKKFSDLAKAKREAHRIAIALSRQDNAAAGLDFRDAATFQRIRSTLEPLGVTLEAAADVLIEASRFVGIHRVVQACEEFARRHPTNQTRKSLVEAIDEFMNAKATRSSRHASDLRHRLGRFAFDHPGKALGDFLPADIQRWLDQLKRGDGQPLGAITRRNFAVVVGSLFEWCRRRGYLADNPCSDLEREHIRKTGDVEFYTPAECRQLLSAASAELAPALALTLFGGLRSAEACRLHWRDINFEERHIAVGSDKSKTASRRLIPLSDNLKAWLSSYRGKPEKPVWEYGVHHFCRAVSQAAEATGIRRLDNGARHSWITYTVALTGDVARAALEAGNSVQTIHNHYRGLATKEKAEEWFGVMPPGA